MIKDKNKKIIISISFNTKKLPQYEQGLTSKWIHNRIKIFQKYTRNSLENQSNQDFITLIEYEDKTEKDIKKALGNYKKLPSNITFIPKSRLERKMKEQLAGYKYLYLVRLDSDDLYRKDYIKQLHNHQIRKQVQAIINQKGYMYDTKKKPHCTDDCNFTSILYVNL